MVSAGATGSSTICAPAARVRYLTDFGKGRWYSDYFLNYVATLAAREVTAGPNGHVEAKSPNTVLDDVVRELARAQ